jgi:hypothetical protein
MGSHHSVEGLEQIANPDGPTLISGHRH